MVNYVHFVLSGECRLIEHMLVRERPFYDGVRYELYDSEIGPREQPEKLPKKIAAANESPELKYNPDPVRS